MTPEQLQAAAIRNAASRRGQVSRLLPVASAARESADIFLGRKKAISEIKKGMDFTRSLHHLPGFFPTPPEIVRQMLTLSGSLDGVDVLEPSAGKGNIAQAAKEAGANVSCVEISPRLVEYLQEKGFAAECTDFLEKPPVPGFDIVLMNPPFERGADHRHILHAFEFLKPGGRLISVCTPTTAGKLKAWVEENKGTVIQLPKKAFLYSERSTGVHTCLISAVRKEAQ